MNLQDALSSVIGSVNQDPSHGITRVSTSSPPLSEGATTKERNTLVYKVRNIQGRENYMHVLKILKAYQQAQINILK